MPLVPDDPDRKKDVHARSTKPNPQATSATSFLLLNNEITNHRLMYPHSRNANVP
jgi:hypothetical protein